MDNLHWLSKQALTMLFHCATRANVAFGIKFFTMALNQCSAEQWKLYLSNEFLGLVAYDKQLRQLTIRAIDTLEANH